MPTEAELLAAIAANPDDDAARLAHAEWLEANGDPERAEVIRLQLQVAVARPGVSWSERYGREVRANGLIYTNKARWLPGMPQGDGLKWEWVRGYPAVLVVSTAATFRDHGREILQNAPRVVSLSGNLDPAALALCEPLALVHDLRLDVPYLRDAGLLTVLNSPHLPSLKALRVHWGSLTGAALGYLANASALAGLELLELNSSMTASPAQAEAFARSPHLSRLRSLWLQNVILGSKGGQRLWSAFAWRQLASLRLVAAKLDAAGLAGFGDIDFSALRKLFLNANRLGDAGAEVVARADALSGLRELDLGGNLIGQGGAAALAGASHLNRLERLALYRNAIPDASAALLAGAAHLRSLTHLNVSANLIGDAGMMALGRSRVLANLTELVAGENPARPDLVARVTRRFSERQPPLQDEAVLQPAPTAPAVQAEVIGSAEEDGLVRAILADPRDAVARNAYADWLEEHDKPLHAELMRLPVVRGARTHAIIAEIAKALAGSTLTVESLGGLVSARVMLRSFVSKKFGDNAPAWLRKQHVTELHIKGSIKDWAKVGSAPAMAHVRALSLQGLSIGDHGLTQFAGAVVGGPCALSIRATFTRTAGVVALARAPGLAALARLDLTNTRPGPDGLRAIAEGALGQGLQNLIASRTKVGNSGAAVLAGAAWPALVSLSLNGNLLDNTAAQALAAAPGLPRLRNLDLSDNRITEAGIQALAGSPLLARLRWLRCADNPLGTAGWQALARAVAGLPGCVLSISRTGLSEVRLAEFREMLGNRLVQE
jgi:uncharacterized protein (TIGR02996 family)